MVQGMASTIEIRGALPALHVTPRGAVAACVAGIALLCAAASMPGSPLQSTPGAGSPELIVAALAGIVAALGGFLLVVREAWAGRLSTRTALWLALFAHLAVLGLPLLYSRDVYSYALFGRMVSVYHLNPYVARPIDVSGDPFFALAGPGWVHTTSVYGPAFTWISALFARAFSSASDTVMAYRVLAGTASMATVLLVAHSARRLRPGSAAFAVIMVGVNPAVVFLTVGSGHNDALVALSIAAAFAMVLAGRPLLATAVLAVGVCVKVPPAVPLVILVAADVASLETGRRLRRLGAHLAVVASIALVSSAAFLQRHDPTLGTRQLANHVGGIAPLNWIRSLLSAAGTHFGPITGEAMNTVMRMASLGLVIATVASIAWVTARRARAGELTPAAMGAAWAWGLLAFQLLVLAFLPWYVIWVLPLVWLLPRPARRMVIAVSVLQVCSIVVVDPAIYPLAETRDVLIAVGVLAPLVLLLAIAPGRQLVRRLRQGIPLETGPHERAPVSV
jgi:hypothetical protein